MIDECLDLIEQEIERICGPARANLELQEWLSAFVNYARRTWIRGFNLLEWNHYHSQDFTHLTNNCAGLFCLHGS